MTHGIPDDIVRGLERAFNGDVDADSLARIFYFLSDCVSKKTQKPFINLLRRALSNAVLFKQEAEKMVENTKTADNDPKYRQVMYDVWNNFLKNKMTEHPDGGQKLQLAVPADSTALLVSQYCFLRAVYRLPPESFRALANKVSEMGGQVAKYGETALIYARKTQPVARVSLVLSALTPTIITNITRWWNEEITDTQCVKNILDGGLGLAAGIACGIGGEFIGVVIGSFFGPVGTAAGAIVGAVVAGTSGALTAETLSRQLTEWVFGLPKSEALENAFNFLELSPNASNSDVNSQYRRLTLKYQPDKGGDRENWTRLQYSLAVIRESRGES